MLIMKDKNGHIGSVEPRVSGHFRPCPLRLDTRDSMWNSNIDEKNQVRTYPA